jgi:glycosyltransferase involved in cell wall biosynthesis
MKLLYVSTLDHIIHVMLPHLDAARARGWQVDVACNVTRDPKITEAHCDTLHSVPFARNPVHPKNLWATLKLIQLIRKEKYNIVHCHNPSGGFYGRLAATLSGVKCLRVYTAHGFHFHALSELKKHGISRIYRLIESFSGRFLSDAVLVINIWDAEEARKIMPVKKVFFTPGVGVSTEDCFNPALISEEARRSIREEFGVPENGVLITCIGEMISRKGHEHLIWALDQNMLKTSVLVFVGEGILREKLEALAKGSGYGSQIRFAGFRRDIREILAASDIFAFPSLQEGLPCSVQEALSMEVPVIAYKIRGCTDLIDGSCGFLVDWVPSARDLGRGLHSLQIDKPEKRKEMGRAGRRKMIELYDRPKCVEEVLKIYDQLLAARGKP